MMVCIANNAAQLIISFDWSHSFAKLLYNDNAAVFYPRLRRSAMARDPFIYVSHSPSFPNPKGGAREGEHAFDVRRRLLRARGSNVRAFSSIRSRFRPYSRRDTLAYVSLSIIRLSSRRTRSTSS